jgi:hypothetical protein
MAQKSNNYMHDMPLVKGTSLEAITQGNAKAGGFSAFVSFYVIFVSTIFLFAGCSQEEIFSGDTVGGEIVFSISLEKPSTRVTTPGDSFQSTWVDEDAIGIFAVRHASGASGTSLAASDNYLHNVKATYNSTANKWTLDGSYTFPEDGDVLDFYAYYPYNASLTDPTAISFAVQTNQSTGAGYDASELLIATPNLNQTEGPVNLIFHHAMALVQVDFEEYDATTVTLVLQQVKKAATFDITGAVSALSTNLLDVDIIPYKVGTTLFRALVPPQTFDAGELFIQHGTELYTIVSSDITAVAGKVTQFEVVLPTNPSTP